MREEATGECTHPGSQCRGFVMTHLFTQSQYIKTNCRLLKILHHILQIASLLKILHSHNISTLTIICNVAIMDPGFKVLHDLHLSPLRGLGDPPLLPSLGGLLHRVSHLVEGDISISTTLLWLNGSHLLQGQGVGVHLQMVGAGRRHT